MNSQLSPYIILGIIVFYFLILFGISWWTTRGDTSNESFFVAKRQAPWWLVTIGMIGASISGVTFVSVPGKVGAIGENGKTVLNMDFSYMQVVLGYIVGYVFVALVLMPVYYRLNLTSIYTYLDKRFGFFSYKTGAAFFLLSRTIGAAFRLYLMVMILQKFVLDPLHVPFAITAFVLIGLIWLYTYKGGTKTVLYTDVLLTFCFLTALVLTIVTIGNQLDKSASDMVAMVWNSGYSKVFFFSGGWGDPNNFFKQFLSGALITIAMTGLDQDLMQKNLTCKNIGDAQKNMFTFSGVLIVVNLLFLMLGALLYIYASTLGIATPTAKESDFMYPMLAFNHLPQSCAIFFIIGIVASSFSAADSALTALTTSFCVDFLNFEKKLQNIDPASYDYDPSQKDAFAAVEMNAQKPMRFKVHLGMASVLFLMILIFKQANNDAIINELFKIAGYTYGPLLGMYAFGFYTNRNVRDRLVPYICIVSPIICYVLNVNSTTWFGGFEFGFLILALNGLLTFLGLWIFSESGDEKVLEVSQTM
jgi:Na+/proline symporter